MSDESFEPSSTDFERRFFEGAETVTLEIEVLKETYNDILAAIERNGWEPEEGLLTLLTLGLGYTQGERLLHADDEERSQLIERLLNLESVAAVMKFRTFNFMRDNQVLEMRMSALQNTILGLEGIIQRLRSEKEALKQEVERLRIKGNVSQVETTADDVDAQGARNGLQAKTTRAEVKQPKSSWISRLSSYLKKSR